jgi:hypothetical protein
VIPTTADEPDGRDEPYQISQQLIIEIDAMRDDVDAGIEYGYDLIDGFAGQQA